MENKTKFAENLENARESVEALRPYKAALETALIIPITAIAGITLGAFVPRLVSLIFLGLFFLLALTIAALLIAFRLPPPAYKTQVPS
ncbi:Uncharacterised protein [Candidatus Anstonella stagnisolia]|nr:Uncharacterised protein [Candidatus Anstonella stagnisolia]